MNDQAVFKKIKKVLEFVWDSPCSSFYRKKYNKVGINLIKDINSLEDFQKLPFLTREELVNSDPFERFYLPKERIKGVNFSGNTTGNDLVAILRAGLKNPAVGFMARKALELQIKSAMILLTDTAFWGALTRPSFRHRSILRCLGSIYDLARAIKIIKLLKVEAIQTTPTILELAIPYLKKENLIDQIRYLVIGGENCSKKQSEYFKSVFKNTYFTFNYALSEAGITGYTCEYLADKELNVYHPLSTNCYFELINPEKESVLALTHIHTKIDLPMIRYKTSDVVKFFEEKCVCGEHFKMKALGRLGIHVLEVRGYFLQYEELEKAIISLYRYLASYKWKLVISDYSKQKILPKLKLQVIPKKDIPNNIESFIAKTVSSCFLISKEETLANLVENKVFSPLEVEFVDSFDLATKHKPLEYNLDPN